MTKDEALKLALDCLEDIFGKDKIDVGAINALRQAIAEAEKQESDDLTIAYMAGLYDGKNKDAPQPKQEPVAWKLESAQAIWFERTDPEAAWELPPDVTMTPLYTTPQRKWVGLTDEERDHFEGLHLYAARNQVEAWIEGVPAFIYAIEAKLREKNGC